MFNIDSERLTILLRYNPATIARAKKINKVKMAPSMVLKVS